VQLDGNEYQASSTTGDNEDTVIGASYSTEMAGASVSAQAMFRIMVKQALI
jgi:hypothetical protein